ncbi:MAG: hypothetical protein ACRC18_06650 [Cetobacterium sp.]
MANTFIDALMSSVNDIAYLVGTLLPWMVVFAIIIMLVEFIANKN